jgi:hypothetical protein
MCQVFGGGEVGDITKIHDSVTREQRANNARADLDGREICTAATTHQAVLKSDLLLAQTGRVS